MQVVTPWMVVSQNWPAGQQAPLQGGLPFGQMQVLVGSWQIRFAEQQLAPQGVSPAWQPDGTHVRFRHSWPTGQHLPLQGGPPSGHTHCFVV